MLMCALAKSMTEEDEKVQKDLSMASGTSQPTKPEGEFSVNNIHTISLWMLFSRYKSHATATFGTKVAIYLLLYIFPIL